MLLRFLYHTLPGRVLLKGLTAPGLSAAAGVLLDSPLSAPLIGPFARAGGIDMGEYETDGVRSFNDFFSRKIREGLRPVDMEADHLIAPCDGLLSVWPIVGEWVLPVKQSRYTLRALLRDGRLAKHYEGGFCFVYRLCVNHYHRYCYVDTGRAGRNRRIPGILHTVQPIALRQEPVFAENAREYTLIRSEAFGPLVQMEVGAMLVGRIVNYRKDAGDNRSEVADRCVNRRQDVMVTRGEEKGYFQYGGSTVIVLTGPGAVRPDEQIRSASQRGEETPVRMGQCVGVRPSPYWRGSDELKSRIVG